MNVVAMEMSKAALGTTETVQSSSSSGYAQAKVHQAVSKTILRARARQIAMIIMRDLVRPLIRLNFGKDVAVPTFAFVLPDPVDIREFGQGIKALVESGLKVEQSWVRSRIGAPEPKEDAEILVPPPKSAPTPAAPATDNETPPPAGETDEAPDADEAGDAGDPEAA